MPTVPNENYLFVRRFSVCVYLLCVIIGIALAVDCIESAPNYAERVHKPSVAVDLAKTTQQRKPNKIHKRHNTDKLAVVAGSFRKHLVRGTAKSGAEMRRRDRNFSVEFGYVGSMSVCCVYVERKKWSTCSAHDKLQRANVHGTRWNSQVCVLFYCYMMMAHGVGS